MTTIIKNKNGKRPLNCDLDYTRPHKMIKIEKNYTHNTCDIKPLSITTMTKKIEPYYDGKKVLTCKYNSLQLSSNPNDQDHKGYTSLMYSIVNFSYDYFIINKILDKN